MIIKYKTNWSKDSISKVEIIRETDKCVFLIGHKMNPNSERRETKLSEHGSYFNSYQEAKDYLILLASRRIAFAEREFNFELKQKQNIESLEESL